MESPADVSAAPWQQQQSPYFPPHPPPGSLSTLNPSSLPYPLTGSTGSNGSAGFDPMASSSAQAGGHAAGYQLAHRRNNSLAASTSSTDSGFSDMSDPTLQLRSSTRSDNTDASFDAGNTTVTPLRHSKRDISDEQSHPSGLVAPPTLLDQELHQDGRPRRPMNAFMIYARHRRPEFQKNEPGLKTGDLSKRLSAEWKALEPVKKSFYLDQAKILKDHFHEKFPTYVYRRRPNNQGRRSRHARSARGSSGSGRGSSTDSSDSLGSTHSPGSGSPGFVSPVTGEFPSASQFMASTGSNASGYRLHSSLSSSTSSSNGAGASRPYDPPPMLQLSGRHAHDFDQQWPATPPQPYSPAPSSATSQMYSPYPTFPQTQRWDPTFARSYDSASNPLSRTWSAGYAGAPDYVGGNQAMPYPYAVSAPMNRSNEHLPVSDADYARYTKGSLSMSMALPSPGLGGSTSGSRELGTSQGWMPPTPQLPPPMVRQEGNWQGGSQPGRATYGASGGGSGHSSSSESLPNAAQPSSSNKYYGSQGFNPASLMQQPVDQQDPGGSPSLPPTSHLPGESESQT